MNLEYLESLLISFGDGEIPSDKIIKAVEAQTKLGINALYNWER